MKTIRWASIGCGNVCEVKSLPAMYKLPGSDVAGVFARNHERAADFAARHHIAKAYESVDALLSDPQVDIVYIATPPSSHLAYTMAVLDAGKHVYVEKPMGLNYAECLQMQMHATAKGLKLFVAHYRRALPYFIKVKSLLQSNAIGELVCIQLEQYFQPGENDVNQHALPWRLQQEIAGGGYFFDLAPHALDIISFITESNYAAASGKATNIRQLYKVEDTITAMFELTNGVAGTAQWSFVAGSQTDRLTFVGTNGKLTCSIFAFDPIVLKAGKLEERFNYEKPQHIQMPFIKTIIDELNDIGTCPSHAAEALTTAFAMDKMMGRL